MSTIYDQDSDPTITLDELREQMGYPPLDEGYVQRVPRHFQERPRHSLARGVAIGLVVALVIVGTVYAVLPKHPAVVKLTTTTSTTTPHVAPLPPPAPTTTAVLVYNAQGQQVPPGTPGAVPAGSGPPATVTVNGTTAPNPIMAKVPGVVYTAPVYDGAPVMGTVVGDHPGVVDPEGRTVSQYLVAMGLPPGTRVAVVGSEVVGYVP